jgi:predicted dehydrogenase
MEQIPTSLKIALIGYGYAGKTIHAPLIASVPGLNLVAVVSSNAQQVLADFPKMKVYDATEALLAESDIDAVVIATPNHTHFELAKQALLVGKHVVVDKPFTLTANEARALTVLSEPNKRVLSVFHNRRWDADYLTLRELISSGKLGELTRFESRFDRFRPEVRARWREQTGAGSGLWYDLGPHLLDQALQLFGRPITLQADFALQRQGAQVVDYFEVKLRYDTLQVTLRAGMLEKVQTPRYVLQGTAGCYTKYGLDTQEDALRSGELTGVWGHDPLNGEIQMSRSCGGGVSVVPNLLGDYRLFYSEFRDAILLQTANPVSPDEAVLTMELLELAIESARRGRVLST